MKLIHAAAIGALAAAAFGAGVLAQQPARPAATGQIGPVPANIKPLRVEGVGLNVADIDAERAWYETVLGMHKVGQFPATGEPREYIMSMAEKNGEGPVLALLKGARQPGATSYGRMIMVVPDSAALAAHLMTHGVAARKVAEGAYFIADPEGNNIELYTPPAE